MRIYVSDLPLRRISGVYQRSVTIDRSYRDAAVSLYRTLRKAGVPSYLARWRITRMVRAGQQSTTTK